MKKIILILVMMFLVSGCSTNKGEEKLMDVLEEDGFECDIENSYCKKTTKIEEIDRTGECVREVAFNEKIYNVVCYSERNDYSTLTRDMYNWGINYLEGKIETYGAFETFVELIIDDTGDDSCTGEDTLCDTVKTSLMSNKKDFLNIVDKADIELEDIQ